MTDLPVRSVVPGTNRFLYPTFIVLYLDPHCVHFDSLDYPDRAGDCRETSRGSTTYDSVASSSAGGQDTILPPSGRVEKTVSAPAAVVFFLE